MIEMLVEKISIENLSSTVGENLLDPQGNPILEIISHIFSSIDKTKNIADKDPIQPVIDIISRSLINHDYETTRQGFELLQQSTNNILESNYYKSNIYSLILERIALDFTSFIKLAIKKNENDLILKSLKILHDIEDVAFARRFKDVIIIVIESFNQIEKLAVQQNMQNIESEALNSLKQIRDRCDILMPVVELNVCEILLEKNKEDTVSLVKKAYLLRINGQYKEALTSFDKLLEINPTETDYIYEKVMILYKLAQYEEALMVSDKFIEISPDNFEAFFIKGDVLYRLNRYDEAIVAFHKAIEINPEKAEVWKELGNTYLLLHKYEKSKESYKKAHELDSTFQIPLD